MRVPIENGSGLSTRVSDSIKPSAAYWNSVYKELAGITGSQIGRLRILHHRRIHGKHIYHERGRLF
jgi:hypothetical protein